ncbi:MAG: alpha/beta fold hydrolase [Methanobacteriota archaeon]
MRPQMALVLAALVATPLVPFVHTAVAPAVTAHTASEVSLVSFDNATTIWITVFQPNGSGPDAKAPILLHSHGWSGSRWRNNTAGLANAKPYLDAGFGVVSIDMRGHGQSGGQARVHDPDFEIKDVSHVVNYTETLDWVLLEDTVNGRDPVMGALGGSYGGGYQILLSIFDPRLDAMAPDITWHDLVQSLAPNGAVKSDWVHLLYLGGKASARVDPMIDTAYREAMLFNGLPDGTPPYTVNVVSEFREHSPVNYPGGIGIPTYLTQGSSDTLFNVNQAVANYEAIAAHPSAPKVKLLTHLDGHILNSQGTIPVPSPVPVGVQPAKAGSPCGGLAAKYTAWYNHTLKGAADTLPGVEYAMEDGTCVSGASWPLATGSIGRLASGVYALPQAPGGARVLVPIPQFPSGVTLLGIPTLSGFIQGVDAETTVYFSLVVQGPSGLRTVNSQVTPFHLDAPAPLPTLFEIDLGGVGTTIGPGETLYLGISNFEDQYATNANRIPGAATLNGLFLRVPTL